jgi:hypothetical protein
MRNAFSNAFGASGGGADATKLPLAGGTLTGQLIQSTNGAASTAALVMSGAPYKAGTATTNHPLFYFNQSGATAPTTWSTKGTCLGMSLPAADSYPAHGDAIRVLVDNVPTFSVDKTGDVYAVHGFLLGKHVTDYHHGFTQQSTSRMNIFGAGAYVGAVTANGIFCASSTYFGWTDGTAYNGTVDTLFIRGGAAACIQMGADAAGVVNQHFKACNRITSDGVGADLKISGGNGRGGAGGNLNLSYYTTAGAGVAGTLTDGIILDTTGMVNFASLVASADVAAVSTHSVAIKIAGTTYNFMVRT